MASDTRNLLHYFRTPVPIVGCCFGGMRGGLIDWQKAARGVAVRRVRVISEKVFSAPEQCGNAPSLVRHGMPFRVPKCRLSGTARTPEVCMQVFVINGNGMWPWGATAGG